MFYVVSKKRDKGEHLRKRRKEKMFSKSKKKYLQKDDKTRPEPTSLKRFCSRSAKKITMFYVVSKRK